VLKPAIYNKLVVFDFHFDIGKIVIFGRNEFDLGVGSIMNIRLLGITATGTNESDNREYDIEDE